MRHSQHPCPFRLHVLQQHPPSRSPEGESGVVNEDSQREQQRIAGFHTRPSPREVDIEPCNEEGKH